MIEDRNDLGWWLPKLRFGGVEAPMPRTVIYRTDTPLRLILDGILPESDWWAFVGDLQVLGSDLDSPPLFLRTGHGSGKHEWGKTCHLPSLASHVLANHVADLVQWSALCDLPCSTWALREMIPTTPLFRCEGWEGFPVTREARAFVRDGVLEAIYPYWPADAIERGGRPDDPDWRAKLAAASVFDTSDRTDITDYALQANAALDGGYWSVDFLQAEDGGWWLTDLAEGDRSWRPDAEA